MKTIGIIGSTGSIGTQTLEVISELNALENDAYSVCALSCGKNVELLAKQAKAFNVHYLCIDNASDIPKLRELLGDFQAEIVSGREGLVSLAKIKMDYLVTAIVGMRGIDPTVTAIRNGTNIALANKETLVAAGEIVTREANLHNVKILPVDSEHSAIFQVLCGINREELESIILTCSGGPFRTSSKEELEKVTLEGALRHPTWKMGGKITIDCANLMNKGLEVIEAHFLYDMPYENIEVIVHPESIVHSMIRTVDGAVLAQLGVPSMKLPIQYALTFPRRVRGLVERPDFAMLRELHFENPDISRFPALKLAYDAGKTGGTLPAVMNAANERAVSMFFNNEISFTEISKVVEKTMNAFEIKYNPDLDEILEVSDKAYKEAEKFK